VFLLWLAWRTFRAVPSAGTSADTGARRGSAAAYLSTLGLTLTNPMTILSFAALFVGLGVTGGDAAGAALLTAGVFGGSATWWVLLVAVVGVFRSRVTPGGLRVVNLASGLLIGAFALAALASSVLA
jgi:threonine/homoserine/homoserine lactone efflux protein